MPRKKTLLASARVVFLGHLASRAENPEKPVGLQWLWSWSLLSVLDCRILEDLEAPEMCAR